MVEGRVPTVRRAEQYLREAADLNPGPWVRHVEFAALAARIVAERHPGIEAERAYVLGLLHDIGRRAGGLGAANVRHLLDGFVFMRDEGFEACAHVCLTHSFPSPIKDVGAFASSWDCPLEERDFVQSYLNGIEYSTYDRLIQLCDALAEPSGYCLIEKRLFDVALRRGFNEFTLAKWSAFVGLRQEFEDAIGTSVYDLLPGVVENTFGVRTS
ncbi:MAG: HD domain-containing protein [Chloroflexia bacterium]